MPKEYALTMYLSGEGKQVYDAFVELSEYTGMSISALLFMCVMEGWEPVSNRLHKQLPSPPPPKKPRSKARSRVKSV